MAKRISSISLLMFLPKRQSELLAIESAFGRTLRSLVNQGLPHWNLSIGLKPNQVLVLQSWLERARFGPEKWLSREQLSRIKLVVYREQSQLGLIQQLVQSAKGDWLGFVMVGDAFAPHFVYEVLKHILQNSAAQFLTYDDDVIHRVLTDLRERPQFKPDFSFDLLYSQNYIGLSFVTRKAILKTALKRQTSLATHFPYQLVLSCVEEICRADSKAIADRQAKSSRLSQQYPLVHLASMLRHRDLSGAQVQHHELSDLAQRSGLSLVKRHLKRTGQIAQVEHLSAGLHRVRWPLPRRKPMVSIVIPTKDQPQILKTCIDSILSKTRYVNYELIVVDNQTTDPRALKYLQSIQAKHRHVRLLRYDQLFNYSAINNYAVTQAQGELLVLMNNDVEVLDVEWLDEMIGHALRPEVGCVGAKLLFPDLTIQHGGVAVGMHGVADHMYRAMAENSQNDPYRYLKSTRNPLAVTAAVLAIRKSLFIELKGLDAKRFQVAFNDVDLCLKAERHGYQCVWTPFACLIHHESKTRAPKVGTPKSVTARAKSTEQREINAMKMRWGALLKQKQQQLMTRHAQLRYL